MAGQCPTATCRVTPHGAYAFWRPDQVDPKSGKKGVMHWAWDLGGTAMSTPVYAPETGMVVETATGLSSPWTGFNPGLVLILGESGVYHVLGHLDYNTILVRGGQPVVQGQQVGVMGISHTHWEIRHNRTPEWSKYPTYWQAHGPNSIDPAVWLATVNEKPTAVGAVGAMLLGTALIGAGFGLAKVLFGRR